MIVWLFFKFLVIHLDRALAVRLAVALWWVEAHADRSHSVFEFVSVLIRILSRNRTYFPVHGAEVGVEVTVSLECSRPELSFSVDVCVKTGQALSAQKYRIQGRPFPFSSPFFCLVGGRKAGCVGRKFVFFTPL